MITIAKQTRTQSILNDLDYLSGVTAMDRISERDSDRLNQLLTHLLPLGDDDPASYCESCGQELRRATRVADYQTICDRCLVDGSQNNGFEASSLKLRRTQAR